MKKSVCGFLCISLALGLFSCKKENNNTATSSLSGNWNFVNIHAITSSTAIDNGGGFNSKIISTSDYTTVENGGSVIIAGNTMTGTGITYTANMLVFAQEFEDDVLIDTFSTTLPVTIPPTSSASTFEIIGQDSIHYTSTSMFGAGGSGTPAATGAKFTISGDILKLTSNVLQDKVIDEGGGETLTQHETANVVVTLQKQ